ncbi:MAG: hypothetical protein A4E35_01202 [Methanoregula sp. PtaU1.Bin051]|nr:MAG: hypothetical protein A4E35_01202 [Methanoregula sp. PtaU1.Bin051]
MPVPAGNVPGHTDPPGVGAGPFGGIVWLWKNKQFAGPTVAVALTVVMESFHMTLALLLSSRSPRQSRSSCRSTS